MSANHDQLVATIRGALANASVSSTIYDTDTLAGVIATAVDPDHEKSDPDPNPHEVADGNPPAESPKGDTPTGGTDTGDPATIEA